MRCADVRETWDSEAIRVEAAGSLRRWAATTLTVDALSDLAESAVRGLALLHALDRDLEALGRS